MNSSPEIALLAKALATAQSEIQPASKDGTNPHYKSTFSTLGSVWEACRTALTKNGFSVVQAPQTLDGGDLVLVTRLLHSSGQWLEGSYPIRPVKNDPQGFGSAYSYAKRYSLASMVGVVSSDEDDDGNAGSGKTNTSEAKNFNDIGINLKKTEKKEEAGAPKQPSPLNPGDIAKAAQIKERTESLTKLIDAQKWTKKQLAGYSEAAYGEPKPTLLSEDHYAELRKTIMNHNYIDAMAELEKKDLFTGSEEEFK